jgi:methyltransferase (TIGR00027 family)
VLALKQSVLGEAGAVAGCERVAIPIDLRDDWAGALVASGFDPTQPVVWLGEGLLVYLTEAAARALLRKMASLSSTESFLGTDTFSQTMLAAADRQAWVELYADADAPFVFASDDPVALLRDCG